jgi:O-acetyl-ADP-ribose deacetylase (regulator of RNase III)
VARGDAQNRGYTSLALPLIGAGSGGGKSTKVQSIIEDELTKCQFDGEVRIVRYAKTPANKAVNRNDARKSPICREFDS